MPVDQGGGIGKRAASRAAVTRVCDAVASGCGSGGSGSSREAKMTFAGIKRERETLEAGDTSHVFPAGVFPVFKLSPWPGQGNKD